MFDHLQERLKERGLKFSEIYLLALALECEKDTAILLHDTKIHKCRIDQEESNGNLVILIVREKRPVTIMFRRDNQPFTPSALKVDAVRKLN